MLHKTRGIVFHKIKYSETSIIAKIYTELFGLQSYLFKGIRSPKSKTKSNLLQHLSLIDMEVYHKQKSEIQYVKEIKSAYNFSSIPFNIKKSSIAIFINEILYRSIKEEEANKNLFDFIFNALQFLDLKEDKYADFHLLFIVQLTKYLGFFPQCNYSDINNVFNLKEGVFEQNISHHTYYIQKPISQYLYNLLNISFEDLDSVKIPSKNRYELLEKIIEYYQLHIPAFKNIKSHHILKMVFNYKSSNKP